MADTRQEICKICGEGFEDVKSLAKHLRTEEKIKQEDYAKQYLNKKDLWCGRPIPFKNLQQYLETDFISRENFRKWVTRRATKSEAIEYCFSFLKRRAQSRGLHFAPSHLELRATNCLSIVGFREFLEGGIEKYQEYCRQLGLESRFDYTIDNTTRFVDDMKIFVDTREQKPLTFPCTVEIRTLNVGDYSCDSPYFSDVVVERKSLEDLIGTVGKGYKRFCKEIERGREQGLYIAVVVEEKFDTALNYKGKNSKQTFHGASCFGGVRKIMQSYENIQFLFANDRAGSAEKIKKIFSLGKKIRKMDLQYSYDIGEI